MYSASAKALDAIVVAAALGMIVLSASLESANRAAGKPLPLRNSGKLRVAATRNIELDEARRLEMLYDALGDANDESERHDIQREIDDFVAARQERMLNHIAISELREAATLHALLLVPYVFGVGGALVMRFSLFRLAPHPLLPVLIAVFGVFAGAMAWDLAIELSTFSATLVS